MVITDAPAAAWLPGRGPDADALARLQRHFPRPAAAGNEGMSRDGFAELHGEVEAIDAGTLEVALWNLASAANDADRDPALVAWFHYLLSRLAGRARHRGAVGRLGESLVSGFAAHYPRGVGSDAPYAGFRDDVLLTLGRYLMDPAEWPAPRGSAWREPRIANAHGYYDLQKDVLATVFLQAKYLPLAEVPAWVASMLEIPAPSWRANVVGALVALQPLFAGDIGQAGELGGLDGIWCGSKSLRGWKDGDWQVDGPPPPPAIPAANGAAIIATVRERMTVARLVQWLDTFEANPALEHGLSDLPERFTALYLD